MKYDYATLYNKNAAFYEAHPTAKRALKLGNILLTWLFFRLLWDFMAVRALGRSV